jgi:hypothetical protein
MVGLTEADFGQVDPQETAQKVCVAYLTQGVKVLASAPDGYERYPGFAVFIKANQDGGTRTSPPPIGGRLTALLA